MTLLVITIIVAIVATGTADADALPTPQPSPEGLPTRIPTAQVSFEPVTFWMGNHGLEGGDSGPEEFPQHQVPLAAYQLDKYEVTNAQFAEFIDADGYSTPEYWTPEGWEWIQSGARNVPAWWESGIYHSGQDWPNHPVVGVNWYEAMAYCRFVGGRLPTEAERERAARWDDEWPASFRFPHIWPWGNSFECTCLNTSHCGALASVPVNEYPQGQSPSGVYNLAGNVWEWCLDSYDPQYYQSYPITEWPQHPANLMDLSVNPYKSIRGGGWSTCPDYYARSAMRSAAPPEYYTKATGFRCAWGPSYDPTPTPTPVPVNPFDFNNDGVVDSLDLLIFTEAWNQHIGDLPRTPQQ